MADPVDKECLYINYNGLIVIYLSDNKSIECLDIIMKFYFLVNIIITAITIKFEQAMGPKK